MTKAAMRTMPASGRAPRGGAITPYLVVPLAGVVFAILAHPLIISTCDILDTACLTASRWENKLFWPLMAAISLLLVIRNWGRITIPTHIKWLFAFLAWAGASVIWAYKPEISAIRYIQQFAIVTAVVLPALIMTGRGDLLRGLFLCFGLACVVNLFFVMGPPPVLAEQATPGHTGYFPGKNYLGLFAGVTLLLSINEMSHRGARRLSGIAIAAAAILLLMLSNAKTALAFTFLAPMLAGVSVLARRYLGLPVLTLLLTILAGYAVLSTAGVFDVYRLSYWIYGDSTFTGRQIIWKFAGYEISQRPLLGWGYQSFWLVGPDAPSVVDAPGWVKTMPNSHNGYVDTTLEMGYVGLVLLVGFVGTSLHATQRLIDRSAVRGWIVLTLMYFIVSINGLESMWMRAFEFIWLVFLVLAAEVARSGFVPTAVAVQSSVRPDHGLRSRREPSRHMPERHPPQTSRGRRSSRSRATS